MTHDQQVQAALYAHQAEALDRWTAVTYGKSRTGLGFALHRTIEAFTSRPPVPRGMSQRYAESAAWPAAPAIWAMKGDRSGHVEFASVPLSYFRGVDDRINLRPLASRAPSCGTPVLPSTDDRVKSALTGGAR